MSTNRLNLDFTLAYQTERARYVDQYITSPMFQRNPLTSSELETIANYVLWGKDPSNDLNPNQTGDIELPSRNSTWSKTKNLESLDALIAQPGFHESSFAHTNAPTRIRKETFSRSEARKLAPPYVLTELERLWRQIDELDLMLNYYELLTGKRKNPPRETLLAVFTPEEQQVLLDRAQSLKQYSYLKNRHLLVELRREQFTWRDFYAPTVQRNTVAPPAVAPSPFNIGGDFNVLPLGLKYEGDLYNRIFCADRTPCPSLFFSEDRAQLDRILWETPHSPNEFDFENPDHVYQALYYYNDLRADPSIDEVDSNVRAFLNTIDFYVDFAHLSPIYADILDLKRQHLTNQQIVDIINPRHSKTYNANYISTIYRQKIIGAINEGARRHRDIIELIFDPSAFKKCSGCGETLLVTADNFVRKSKSRDGFSSRCKRCDKKRREGEM